ncbi:MAG: chromosome partitioning protein ParB [Deltaproteobacteria bacterium RBG_16_48_10]|nr:MAG: chromosome partitioning protein ParB [Deltaproteobacteria bacterium RBG_16_48_10]
MVTKKMGLGKGLGALLPELEIEESKTLLYCGIEEIRPNRFQPRKHFDESRLQELVDSIKEKGVLEPLLVRKVADGYELIAGERRWRAAQKAGLREVPVLVKEMEDGEVIVVSLIENLQRDDLNPLEEAGAYKRLVDEFGITQEELGTRLGKDRTSITNTLRLLKLPAEVKDQLLQNRISSGHARAILSLEMKEQQKELCNLIIQKGLSVREAEALAKRWSKKPKKVTTPEKRGGDLESQLSALGDSLRRHLGTRVQIASKGQRGKIEIEYYSFDDLERIVEAILKT